MEMGKSFSLIRELDQKCNECVQECETRAREFASNKQEVNTDEEKSKLNIEINERMEQAISIAEEKLELSKQSYDLVDRTIRKLDDQLAKFAQILSQEKNSNFIPSATASSNSSTLFSTDSINVKHNEKHVINVTSTETRAPALRSATILKGPALAGTTRATRLISSQSDVYANESMLTGEEYDNILDQEAPPPDKKEKTTKKEAVKRSRKTEEEEKDHIDVFQSHNTVTTQETPKLQIKINKERTTKSTKKSSTKKRSRSQSNEERPAQRRRTTDKSTKAENPLPLPAPKPVKQKDILDDHALVNSTHAGMMSISSFNKGKGEPLGGKGQLVGLKGAALASMMNKKKNTKADAAKVDILEADLAVDPNEPVYCYCRQVSFGQMVACDNETCTREWFHFPCVGLTAEPTGKWYCPDCRILLAKEASLTRKK
jgi:hypothetical protein